MAVVGAVGVGGDNVAELPVGARRIEGGQVLVDGEDIYAMSEQRRTPPGGRSMRFIVRWFAEAAGEVADCRRHPP